MNKIFTLFKPTSYLQYHIEYSKKVSHLLDSYFTEVQGVRVKQAYLYTNDGLNILKLWKMNTIGLYPAPRD